MKKVSTGKVRIVEHYTAMWGTHYTVEELYADKKGRETWSVWGSGGYDCELYSWNDDEFKTVIEAEEKIRKRLKARDFIPRVVKELEFKAGGVEE